MKCLSCLYNLKKLTNLNNEQVIYCDYLKRYILTILFKDCENFKEGETNIR